MIMVYTLHIDYLIELIVLEILALNQDLFLMIREYFFEIITALLGNFTSFIIVY